MKAYNHFSFHATENAIAGNGRTLFYFSFNYEAYYIPGRTCFITCNLVLVGLDVHIIKETIFSYQKLENMDIFICKKRQRVNNCTGDQYCNNPVLQYALDRL